MGKEKGKNKAKGLDEKKCNTEFIWLRLRSANVG
jgi:hypothetical protein